MRTRILFLYAAICCFGCATQEIAPKASKIELAKKGIAENCLAHTDYQVVILSGASVEIRHPTAKARVSYSKANRAGILMQPLGDNRTEELSRIRACASPYMSALLDELSKAETARQDQ